MVICFRDCAVPVSRAALLRFVLWQAAEKFVTLVQPTAGGSKVLEWPWRDATKGTWYARKK